MGVMTTTKRVQTTTITLLTHAAVQLVTAGECGTCGGTLGLRGTMGAADKPGTCECCGSFGNWAQRDEEVRS